MCCYIRCQISNRPCVSARGVDAAPSGYACRMTRALALVLAAGALASGLAATATGTSTSRPTLKLVHRAPLEIQGVHFKLRQRVRVTATSDTKSAVRTARTTARGTFTVNLGTWDRCKTITVKARGGRGDRAALVLQPPPPTDQAERGCWGL